MRDRVFKLKPTSSQNKQLFDPIVVGLGLASGILLSIGLRAYSSMTEFVETSKQVMQSHRAIDDIENILSELKDAETGQRGYIITGNQAYLEPYQAVLGQVKPELSNIRQANADNRERQQQIDLLETLVDKKLNFIKITIDARANKGFDAASRLILTNEGKHLMDSIRRIVEQIRHEENDLLTKQLRLAEASSHAMIFLFSSGLFLTFGILFALYQQLYRGIVERKQAQEAMEKHLAAVEAAIDGIAILNCNSQYTYLNQAHLKIFGYESTEELIGKTWQELYYPEEIARFETDVFPILSQQKSWQGEATGKKKDGSTFTERVSLTLLEDGTLICICQDISERQQIEEELREQRLALEYAVEGIARLDTQRRYIAVNKAYANMVGYEPEEMLGMTCQSTVHSEDLAILMSVYQQMLAYGKAETEARGLRKDGSVFYKQVTMVSAWDNRHNFIGHYCFIKDISERKQLEAELQHREERFRVLVNNAPAGIFQTDSQGNCVFVNPQWTELTGLSITEALGTGWASALHPDDRDRVFSEWYDSVKCDREFSLEFRYKTPEDKVIWVFCRATAVRDETGALSGYFGTVIDITGRKQAEERFSLAFNDAAVGMTLVSPEGGFLQVNKALCDIVGYSESELLATDFQTLTHPEDLDIDLNYVAQMLAGEIRTYQMEKRYFHKQGYIVWVLLNVSLVRDDRGLPLYFISQIQDISEQQAALRERKQAEEQLQASLQEKEVLLKEVHHRVKNNLQVIDSLFRHQCRQTQDSYLVSILKECQSRVSSMALLHEKLYQSKDIAHIELADYIQSIVSNLFSSYSFNGNIPGIKLNIEPVILDIETALSCGLIINELVSNCFKYAFYSVKNGQIKISLFINEKTDFRLVIKDNGIGFPENFDLESSKTLGLKIVKSLTRQLGGSLEFNSQQGSEFIITFKGKEESCSLTN